MYRNINRKIFHIISIIVILVIIMFVAGMFILRYQVEGESNLPFQIKKISIIENVEGTEEKNAEEKWNINVNENNDIYIYLEKNAEYSKSEIIESVEINDIKVNKYTDKGEIGIYKPAQEEKRMFVNTKENKVDKLIYTGELESNIKEQKISNQGGIVAFRYAINNISQYISNNNEEVDHSKLLQLTNTPIEDIQGKLSFNIIIKLKSQKKFQANIELDIPTQDIIEKGTTGIEITDLDNIIFKRIEN